MIIEPGKNKKKRDKLTPAYITHPIANPSGRERDSKAGIQSDEDVEAAKDWVEENKK